MGLDCETIRGEGEYSVASSGGGIGVAYIYGARKGMETLGLPDPT